MSRQSKTESSRAMLELWKAPAGAGDPVGCLTSTYTFAPSLFDEQCLARFLDIDSEPNREALPFLLEREARLGSAYAGVLVDHTMAGVEHSLRWDVLPVRIHAGKQHAKLTLLRWSNCIRVIVASANLTEQGYRTNFEVAAFAEVTSEGVDAELVIECAQFLQALVSFVPGAEQDLPQIRRAHEFLADSIACSERWTQARRGSTTRRHLVCTLPSIHYERPRSALGELLNVCRSRGNSPYRVRIASPFYDLNGQTDIATRELCTKMARGQEREVTFAVPAARALNDAEAVPRLYAPISLVKTARSYVGRIGVEALPSSEDKNMRPWHAKMIALENDAYFALMTGSSNFTCAGLGLSTNRNAEANLVTIVDRVEYGRDAGKLSAIWPEARRVDDPDSAEWLGVNSELLKEEELSCPILPSGFLSAIFNAGEQDRLIIYLDPERLPADWRIMAARGQELSEVLSSQDWCREGSLSVATVDWVQPAPPEKLIVKGADFEAFLPINVEDPRRLPPPSQVRGMNADDMLGVLAASDPSAAIRAWSREQSRSHESDDDLDTAGQPDIDPLRRYQLGSTFLHRIRHRARVLAQLRRNIERPVWGHRALDWRLHGFIGIESLASRFFGEFEKANDSANEALLTLADFLIVLYEVDYESVPGALPKSDFDVVFRSFLRQLALEYRDRVQEHTDAVSADTLNFWEEVVQRCLR